MKKFNSQQDILKQVEINKVEVHTRTTHSYFTVLGEEGLGTAEDHYDQIETLKHANQGDMYVMTLSSCPGGCYSGLLAFKNALEGTEAHTVAILEGDLASAGTILPMFFDEVVVTPFTTFMVHSANFGVGRNTASNVERNAAFHAKQVERFLRESYKGFLEEETLRRVIDGVEIYMDEFEIQERMDKRQAFLDALEAGEEGCEDLTCPCHEEEEPSIEDSVVEQQ